MKVRCRSCAAQFEWHARKLFYQGEDAEEARLAATKLALELGGAGIEAFAESVKALEMEQTSNIDDLVKALPRGIDFGMAEIQDEVKRLRFSWSPDRVVEWLLREQQVYEPRPGRFRWVD